MSLRNVLSHLRLHAFLPSTSHKSLGNAELIAYWVSVT